MISLPLPDSPSISTAKGRSAYCRSCACSFWIAGLLPISGDGPSPLCRLSSSTRNARARLSTCCRSPGLHGLATKSTAPSVRACRALPSSLCPERTTILISGAIFYDPDFRGNLEQIRDQRKTLVGTMWQRRQSEVDQCQLGRPAQLPQQLHAMRARVAAQHFKVRAQGKAQGVADQRVVIDDQQQWLFRRGDVRHREGKQACRRCALD